MAKGPASAHQALHRVPQCLAHSPLFPSNPSHTFNSSYLPPSSKDMSIEYWILWLSFLFTRTRLACVVLF